ncbi:uncharacterized protein LOC132276684 [Cornus florida]|uniref:uncharacterized protein LOC132276684 n=1 Tax=Cornus florida TaxID=4283 RepID=UPI00289A5819|nr:uncharacterized protein LOC132276684 [Cornus florida]XP_059634225.1 uncharacterized protein LOC132276684 [Cornus florida]
MVAREKVMDSITFESVELFTSTGCMTLHQCIQLELAALINSEYRLMYKKEDKKLAQICKNLKEAMIYMLQLLEIFERAGDAIETYLQLERTNVPKEQVTQEVASLLAVAGFKLKSRESDLSNIVECCPDKLVLEHSSDPVKERKGQSVFSQSNKKPTHSLPNKTWRLIHTRYSIGSSALSSSILPMHVSWNRKANFCSGIPKTMGSQLNERLKGEGQYVGKFSPVKQLANFVLVVKRGIRFI